MYPKMITIDNPPCLATFKFSVWYTKGSLVAIGKVIANESAHFPFGRPECYRKKSAPKLNISLSYQHSRVATLSGSNETNSIFLKNNPRNRLNR